MTYQEIKQRLTKCELQLKEFQDMKHSSGKIKNYDTTVKKLTVLKESLQKQLKEAEETMLVKTKGGDTAVVGMDRKEAQNLKTDPTVTSIKTSKGQKIKEQEGVAFSKEETMAIAKQVGKAVAKALHSMGDGISHMKARDIEENSFEIYVQYKNDSDDQFSFYISDDTLHLVDFSFDKELVDVGVKPSGEAIVHVDVLANELVKHFKTMQESKKLKEEKEGGLSQEQTSIVAFQTAKALETALKFLGDKVLAIDTLDVEPNSFELAVEYEDGTDDQFSFYISDSALFLTDFSFKKELADIIIRPSGRVVLQVDLLAKELVNHFKSLKEGMSDQEFAAAGEADRLQKHPEKTTIQKIQALIAAQRKNEEMEPEVEDLYQHDDEYLDHLKRKKEATEQKHPTYRNASNQYAGRSRGVKLTAAEKEAQRQSNRDFIQGLRDKGMLEEAPEGTYYIKVAVRDARKALELIDDSPAYSKAVEMDGSDTYYLTDEQLAHDLLMDLGARGIEVTDNNIDLDEASDYAKRRAAERDYQPAKKDAPAKKFREPKNDYFARRKAEMDENEAKDQGGDLDIGHQDDEPDMLKQQVYDIATYAAKLYKILDKYDQYDGEVDFPHWWQKKVILARDYISAAQHYLEFEEKQPAIDALALEEGVNEASHAKLKKEYDALVGKMKQLAQHFKTAEGEKKAKIVAALKHHTARKRELEKQIDAAVGGIGVGQELDSNITEAKATCCGKCGRVHVKGTECKRPFLKGKDHCRYN